MRIRYSIYRQLGHKFVEGWLAPEVLAIIELLNSAQKERNVSGAVAEIGVHHGRLFIGLNLLQRDVTAPSIAIDVFEHQELNSDGSGKGDLEIFKRNVKRWSTETGVVVHQGDSTKLTSTHLREIAQSHIRLFSVDGGHTALTVFSDMNLADATIADGGIVIADDVFNQEWPDVSTGTLRYLDQQDHKLVPFAIGFNKVLFSSQETAEYYRGFLTRQIENRSRMFLHNTEYAGHAVVYIGRVALRPATRRFASRNRTLNRAYHRLKRTHGTHL